MNLTEQMSRDDAVGNATYWLHEVFIDCWKGTVVFLLFCGIILLSPGWFIGWLIWTIFSNTKIEFKD